MLSSYLFQANPYFWGGLAAFFFGTALAPLTLSKTKRGGAKWIAFCFLSTTAILCLTMMLLRNPFFELLNRQLGIYCGALWLTGFFSVRFPKSLGVLCFLVLSSLVIFSQLSLGAWQAVPADQTIGEYQLTAIQNGSYLVDIYLDSKQGPRRFLVADHNVFLKFQYLKVSPLNIFLPQTDFYRPLALTANHKTKDLEPPFNELIPIFHLMQVLDLVNIDRKETVLLDLQQFHHLLTRYPVKISQ